MDATTSGKERVGMSKRYERYRKEYSSRQLFSLYLSHRDSAWFKERYSVEEEWVGLRERVGRRGRGEGVKKYLKELEEGKWDGVGYDLNGELLCDLGLRVVVGFLDCLGRLM